MEAFSSSPVPRVCSGVSGGSRRTEPLPPCPGRSANPGFRDAAEAGCTGGGPGCTETGGGQQHGRCSRERERRNRLSTPAPPLPSAAVRDDSVPPPSLTLSLALCAARSTTLWLFLPFVWSTLSDSNSVSFIVLTVAAGLHDQITDFTCAQT